ncbi:MAG: phosphatidylserine decarboxylase [bacterium]
MPDSVLSRLSESRLNQSFTYSSTQAAVDGLVSTFLEETTKASTLASVVTGNFMFQAARAGSLALLGSRVAAPLAQTVSLGTALFSEAAAFETTQRALRVGLEGADASILRLTGERGILQGTLHTMVNFGSLRGVGYLAREQGAFVQHLAQINGMVGANQLMGALNFQEAPRGSLAEQYLHAAVTDLQMTFGMGLVHAASPSLTSVNRALELNLRLQEATLAERSFSASPARSILPRAEETAEASGATPARLHSFSLLGLSQMHPSWAHLGSLGAGGILGMILGTMRPRTAAVTLGATTLLTGLGHTLLSGHVDLSVPGLFAMTAGLVGWGTARSLARKAQVNPFEIPRDTRVPQIIATPEGSVRPDPVSLTGSDVHTEVPNPLLEADGYPAEFRSIMEPPRSLTNFQRFFYRHFNAVRFSAAMGVVSRLHLPDAFLHRFLTWFAGKQRIDLNRFMPEDGSQLNYPTFNAFFTRTLRDVGTFFPGASPCDGRVLYLARGTPDQVVNVKGQSVPLRALLGERIASQLPDQVIVAIVYLAPRDYHRGHSPVGGEVFHAERVPGEAWTVGPEITIEEPRGSQQPGGKDYLLTNARNNVAVRLANGSVVATSYIAATNVFSTIYHLKPGDAAVEGGHEQTYNFGSTNVYVYPAEHFQIANGLRPGQAVTFGQTPFVIPRPQGNAESASIFEDF